MPLDDILIPYQLPFPKDAHDETVIPNALGTGEREWVLQAAIVWLRPLCLD